MKLSTSLRITFLAFLVAITGTVKAQNPFGFDFENGASSVELSFRKESNLIIVPIKLNGEGPYNFIVDTGSESGLIFEKWVIAEGNLVNARKIPVYGNDGGKVTDLLVANGLNVNFQGVKGVQQTMLVLDDNVIDVKNVLGANVHGVLGSEIFNRFVVDIDYDNKILRLHDPKTYKRPKGYKRLPLEIENFRPFIRVQVGQKGHKPIEVKLLVDSGASSALFLDEEHNEEIVLPKKTIEHSLGRGLAGIIEGRVGRIHKLKFGSYRFSHVTTSFPKNWGIGSDNHLIKERKDIRYGTLGADILSRFHVIFDYANSQVFLRKSKEFANAFVFNTIGFNVISVGQELNEYVIVDIIPDSPAAKAEIEVGDELISLNGKPAFFHSLTEINNILREKPGGILTVILRRGDELIKKTVRHKRIL